MTFWKVNAGSKPQRVAATKFKNENLLERHLEDWITADPSLLGEPLLIIGRQVIIPEVKDRLDLLAVDPKGNAVIIELKRGRMSDPVDLQALRYASYISKWKFSDFENHAKGYLNGDDNFNFNEVFENFCNEANVDEIPDINTDQRIIIAGAEVSDKLGSVALWLFDHKIDIKIMEIDSYKEGDAVLIHPRVIIPQETNKFSEVGQPAKSDVSKPWLFDGRSWHLEKRLRPMMREVFVTLDTLIRENLKVDGPNFNQKLYISYQHAGSTWLLVRTFASLLILAISVKAGSMDQAAIAQKLGIEEFDEEDTLSEKLNLPSSVRIIKRNATTDRIQLRIKEDFDVKKPAFLELLKQTLTENAKG